jgi:hypothetical protein
MLPTNIRCASDDEALDDPVAVEPAEDEPVLGLWLELEPLGLWLSVELPLDVELGDWLDVEPLLGVWLASGVVGVCCDGVAVG